MPGRAGRGEAGGVGGERDGSPREGAGGGVVPRRGEQLVEQLPVLPAQRAPVALPRLLLAVQFLGEGEHRAAHIMFYLSGGHLLGSSLSLQECPPPEVLRRPPFFPLPAQEEARVGDPDEVPEAAGPGTAPRDGPVPPRRERRRGPEGGGGG